MHCYFVLAGDATIPVLYHVERVREGRSFATRTVQARQRGRAIFTTTLSFVREGSAGTDTVDHSSPLPDGVGEWLDANVGSVQPEKKGGGAKEGANDKEEDDDNDDEDSAASPFEALRMDTLNNEADNPAVKRTRQWLRCRGTISAAAGHQGHLSALAYMSDSYFIGTIARVHNLWRWGRPNPRPSTTVTGEASRATATTAAVNTPQDTSSSEAKDNATANPRSAQPLLAEHEKRENAHVRHERTIGMMVSLDHSIYFHRPREIHADDWLFSEMESHWAGDGRGLVFQKIWNREGALVATCIQEGLVRLEQRSKKAKL